MAVPKLVADFNKLLGEFEEAVHANEFKGTHGPMEVVIIEQQLQLARNDMNEFIREVNAKLIS